MAKIVNLQVLIDGDNDEEITEFLRVALMTARPDGSSTIEILDFHVASIDQPTDELTDSIVNETYLTGQAFDSWLIYSASEAKATGEPNDGYWSYQYGWTSRDLATRFEPVARDMPHSAGNDACMIIDI
ncbi:hypothetical protein [Polaromonas naphthalenivorans]|uniref:Uncharacterized protein n=1 Tax=Polaromonas naphthalenivorans (strain CJ2) TaxID=365044 RepID=A1VV24_POLNA|nr:hypothetical protein [Polaromonas naphthalenivorans]ABM39502.1 hypothetical protein Pnap_4219 [Polaromonas naphthalenivorans CJ2]